MCKLQGWKYVDTTPRGVSKLEQEDKGNYSKIVDAYVTQMKDYYKKNGPSTACFVLSSAALCLF
jgi:hypothetical protein